MGKQTSIARAVVGIEDRHLSFETEDRAMNDRDAEALGHVVDEVTGREIVGPVDDEVETGQQFQSV